MTTTELPCRDDGTPFRCRFWFTDGLYFDYDIGHGTAIRFQRHGAPPIEVPLEPQARRVRVHFQIWTAFYVELKAALRERFL